ncbi:hypothetical protein [Streptomyces sp. NPDC048521]|uniref:hypothetical protein n=1 Tax=Streptomyces sp. NPDC048521 TaxID=3365566 RepID=UPI0037120985
MSLLSEHVLVDTIYALGLMICFYYALTAIPLLPCDLRRIPRRPPAASGRRTGPGARW